MGYGTNPLLGLQLSVHSVSRQACTLDDLSWDESNSQIPVALFWHPALCQCVEFASGQMWLLYLFAIQIGLGLGKAHLRCWALLPEGIDPVLLSPPFLVATCRTHVASV